MFKLSVFFLMLTNANLGSSIVPAGEIQSDPIFITQEECEENGRQLARDWESAIRSHLMKRGHGVFYGSRVICVFKAADEI